MIFKDRDSAGSLLAFDLLKYRDQDLIILAIPNGGVPVAVELANILNAPLDVILARKVGLPFRSELAAGAICEGEEPIWNEKVLSKVGMQPDDFYGMVKYEQNRIQYELEAFRKNKRLPTLVKKTVILVDDGIGTGATMLAAIKYLKSKKIEKLIVATPVASTYGFQRLKDKVDDMVVLQQESEFDSVAEWYEDSAEVSNEQVISLLTKGYEEKETLL